ncbi:ankyrin repeat domain-containing protein [Corallococcus sp. bb12-1]|uniref:ankyrin repeat domain-containing protein n=1 Tax=Corallococcus sp. bb12-1 TaxID=2996784 RepID=UPI00227216C3|nr:ankyrin repeat domain-containing protein [Corallococcus sp. bb12-1]MCY1044514.1 ankyrin repeat domain-containing protein [Corallococcus sp. bb12-1]
MCGAPTPLQAPGSMTAKTQKPLKPPTSRKAAPRKKPPAKSLSVRGDEQSLSAAADSGDCVKLRALLARGVDADARDPVTGYSALHYAAMNGRLEAAKLLLAAGADVGARIRNARSTPLDMAAGEGRVAVVKVLLAAGAPLGQPHGRFGWTALHSAVAHGHAKVVEKLLGAGMAVDTPGKYGITPLGTALLHEEAWEDVVPVLLAAGARLKRISRTLLREIANDAKYALLRPLLQPHGLPAPKKPRPPPALPPLHEAAATGNVARVKRLLKAGARVKATLRRTGTTALHLAARGNHVKVMDVLIAAGASLDGLHKPSEWAPLHEAVFHGHREATERLIRTGMDVNLQHPKSVMPLFLALDEPGVRVLPLLLEAGADAEKPFPAVQHDSQYAKLRPLFRKYLRPARKR